MARPKKEEDSRRSERINPRFTPAERMEIERAAIEAGLSASEYVRVKALGGRVVVAPRRTLDPAVFDELRRIGNNLNQLARIANQTGRIPARLSDACAALEQILVRELDAHLPTRPASGRSAAAERESAPPPPPPTTPRGP